MSRVDHFNITLPIPVKTLKGGNSTASRSFRLIRDDNGASGRHNVHEGRMIVLKSGQWFLLTQKSFSVEDGIFEVIRTNRGPSHLELTGKYEHGGDVLDPTGPYAQKLIEALYFFGYFTDVTRRSMLDTAVSNWQRNTYTREKEEYKSALRDALSFSNLTLDEAQEIINEFEAKHSKPLDPVVS